MTTVLVIAVFLLALYYPVMLHFRSDWRSNSATIGLMIFSLIIVFVLVLPVYRQLVAPPQDFWRNVVYAAIGAGLLMQNIILTRIQNRRSSRIKNEERSRSDALRE